MKIFKNYSLGLLQEISTAIKLMDKMGVKPESFHRYVDERKEKAVRGFKAAHDRNMKKLSLKPCPKCGCKKMILEPLNNSKRNRIPGGWKSWWFCPECEHHEMNMKTVAEELDGIV